MIRLSNRRNKQGRFGWRKLLMLYIILLIASQVVRSYHRTPSHPVTERPVVRISSAVNQSALPNDIIVIYDEHRPKNEGHRVPVLLIDSLSPISPSVSRDLVLQLSKSGPVIMPDLPTVAASSRTIQDHSVRGQASVMLALMDHLRIVSAHVIAYEMGGPVAVNLADLAPGRVKSLSMVSAVGVQEFELLGSYHINRALYAARLAALWVIQNGIPHMGLLDGLSAKEAQARVLYESDLRPIRPHLDAFQAPMLILHESPDQRAPAAARELHRIVPQSELILYRQEGRNRPALSQQMVAEIDRFIEHVENNRAATRSTATAGRIAEAGKSFSDIPTEPIRGKSLALVVILLAAATLISEDLTCIGAGLLVARGTLGIVPAVAASFTGILIGDILLYLAGRFFGRPALKVPPFKWLVKEADIKRTSDWFTARGPIIILTSRFMPGLRLPTYFAAGVLHTRLRQFVFYFTVAVALWTPLLVGLSAAVGTRMFAYYDLFGRYALVMVIATIGLLWVGVKFITPLFSYRGRRLLLSSFRRMTRWEFWPPVVFYLPVIGYYIYLSLRFRSFTLFTACNPGIPEGGFREESKAQILNNLKDCAPLVAHYRLIGSRASAAVKTRQATDFLQQFDLDYPVVLKPDVGQRGEGVAIIRSDQQLKQHLSEAKTDQIIQEYADGREFGIFYYRYPDADTGRIFSITDKRLLKVTGDGRSTLERLILQDDRAVCMAPFHMRKHQDKLFTVLREGETFELVEVGTHCRGALFLDGNAVWSPELEAAIDKLSKQFEGFYFGRYDILTPSVDDFRTGRNFKIVELNGVTSEATHIYSPGTSLWRAYGVLMRQWRLAFEIGAINSRRGHKPASLRTLLGLLIRLITGQQPPAATTIKKQDER